MLRERRACAEVALEARHEKVQRVALGVGEGGRRQGPNVREGSLRAPGIGGTDMAIATQEQQVVDSVEKRLYIGGEWRDASGGGTLEVLDPATEEPLCEVADGTPEDAMAALGAAVEAQGEFAATPANDRAGILWKAFELMTARVDELA